MNIGGWSTELGSVGGSCRPNLLQNQTNCRSSCVREEYFRGLRSGLSRLESGLGYTLSPRVRILSEPNRFLTLPVSRCSVFVFSVVPGMLVLSWYSALTLSEAIKGVRIDAFLPQPCTKHHEPATPAELEAKTVPGESLVWDLECIPTRTLRSGKRDRSRRK